MCFAWRARSVVTLSGAASNRTVTSDHTSWAERNRARGSSRERAGPTWVVHASLDDVVQGEAAGRLLVPQLLVYVWGERLGHVVVVHGEVGELFLRREVQLALVVGVSERHGSS